MSQTAQIAQAFAANLDAAEREVERLRATQAARRARYLDERQLLSRLKQWIEVSRPGTEERTTRQVSASWKNSREPAVGFLRRRPGRQWS